MTKNKKKNYPLAIVLDAEYMFDLYVGNAVLFAEKDTYFNINNGKFTFSNKNFYQFIKNEVIFELERTYKTSPFISVIGEQTSANLITCFLGEETPLINSYICINPNFFKLYWPATASL